MPSLTTAQSLGHLIIGRASSLIAATPPGKKVIAAGELIRKQNEAGQLLLPDAWDQYLREAMKSSPQLLPAAFADKETYLTNVRPRYAEGVKPHTSLRYNLEGLRQLVETLSMAIARHVILEGAEKTWADMSATVLEGKHAPVSKEFLREVDVLLPQWALRWARANKVTVRFENMDLLDRIPKGDPAVWIGNHDSIFANFLFWIEQPRIRFVADVKNFHDAYAIRPLGYFLDTIGLPFVDRNKVTGPERNKQLFPIMIHNMMEYGIQPLFYIQGTRAPRAYKEDGSLDRSGLYSTITSLGHPERYYNPMGTAETVFQTAERLNKTVYIPVLVVEGAEQVMSKIAKMPPFIQPNTTGATVTYRLVEILPVIPTTRNSLSNPHTDLGKKMIDALRRGMGIDDHLRRVVAGWAQDNGRPGLALEFARTASRDERFYIIADRIRSVHPSHPERGHFKKQLLDLISNPTHQGRILDLLKRVSLFVKKHEYDHY